MARPVKVRQVVQVKILGTSRLYSYAWEFMPGVVAPLAVGDKVEIPGNMVTEDGGSGTVAVLGSDYNGDMKYIVRLIKQADAVTSERRDAVINSWDPERNQPIRSTGEDIWDNFGQGDYA